MSSAALKRSPEPNGSPGDLETIFAAIAEGAARRERERTLPYQEVRWLKQAGFGRLRIPVEDGGAGNTLREALSRVIALGAADANIAHIFRNHFAFTETYARRPSSPVARDVQRRIVQGALVGFASGELGASVGGRNFETRLTRDGDGYRLNGSKYYSTGTLYADLVMVRTMTAEGVEAIAIVPSDRDGIERIDDWDGMGQRLTGSGTTKLTDVRVTDAEIVVHREGTSFRQPYSMTIAQLYLTSVLAGILRNVLSDATALVRRRSRTFVHAASEQPRADPLLQHAIGVIGSLAFAGEATVLAAADTLDAAIATAGSDGLRDPEAAHAASLAAAKAKVVLDETSARAATLLFDVGGASATKLDANLDRHWRNARTLASHNPWLYKAQAIGNWETNGVALPLSGFF